MRHWRRVVLETTPKPFFALPGRSFAQTAEHLFNVWRPLLQNADAHAILLFIGDGNEVFDFTGELTQPLEWARYNGFCNIGALPELYYSNWYDNRLAVPYRDDLPETTYRDLLGIATALRAASRALVGRVCQLGVALDPGPEFSRSEFKYRRHPELIVDYTPDGPRSTMRFLDPRRTLKADPRRYAGFPGGIERPTTFGEFFARQLKAFAGIFGIDYVWFSNGLGYSPFAWSMYGELFHKQAFFPERAAAVRAAANAFWADFRKHLPDMPIEVRGTDQSVGHDLSVHGASHLDIQRIGGLDAEPCNLPVLRAELLAKEVAVYLTRLAGAPGQRVIYRSYLNDPWFAHDPWEQIYDREPFEIYSANACARLLADGTAISPSDLHILSIDDEEGGLSQRQALEVTPHYLRALHTAPTAVGPVVWVYPFDTWHRYLHEAPEHLRHTFFHDHFTWRGIEGGLPLNTVCRDSDFVSMAAAGALPESIFLVPVAPQADAMLRAALQARSAGRSLLMVGPLDDAPAELREALGLDLAAEGLEGDLAVELDGSTDASRPLRHHALISGGGLRETAGRGARPIITVTQNGQSRVYAAEAPALPGSGRLLWLRGSLPFSPAVPLPHIRAVLDDPRKFQRPQDWPALLLARLGYTFEQMRAGPDIEPTRWFVKVHDNAYWFVGSKADTTVTTRLRFPIGAPLFTGVETAVEDGCALDPFGKTINHQARCFVDTPHRKRFAVRRIALGRRWTEAIAIDGLAPEDQLTLLLGDGAVRSGQFIVATAEWAELNPNEADRALMERCQLDPERSRITLSGVSGSVYFKWASAQPPST